MDRRLRRLLALAAVLCCLVPVARAQTTSGRISGTVSDTSGAVLPGVTVTISDAGTGLTRSTTTDAQGAYRFLSLPRGNYSVTAELIGFKKGLRTGYELVADGRVTVDFTLAVGMVSEVVEVTAGGETVNTVSGEVARVVDREQVENLALNGRNYLQLATLIPGAPLLDDNALNIMTGLGINTSVNGSRQNASLLTVDGGFNMDSGSNNSQISNVGIDFIQEVTIKTANFSAEYGRNSGANINVVTRTGSNRFTGRLFEYNRDDSFDANDYFSNSRGVAKPPLKFNNFGWNLGGPIRKNKLFFFVGEEWKIIRRSATPTLRTIPTRAMRQGDFSGITTVINDPLTGQPFPGNIIPSNRITADGRAIANVYGAAEQGALSYTDRPIGNNALFGGDNPFDWRQDYVRLDYQPSVAHRLTLRVIHDNYDLVDPFGTFIGSQLPTIPTNRKRPGRNYQVGHTWTMASNLINEFKANASWNGQRIPPQGDAWKRETYGFTFPQLFSGGGRFDNSIPDTTISGYALFNGAARSLISPTTDIQFSDTLTWLRGSHSVKFGGMVIRNRKDQNGRSVYAGQVDFNATGNTRTSGHSFADALLGNFRTYTEFESDPMGFFRFWQAEAFVSDTWRVSRNLSLEAGLRYAWHSPIYTQANNMANFNPTLYDPARAVTVLPNGTLVPGVGNRLNGMVRAGDGVPQSELGRVPAGNTPQVLAVPAGASRGFYQNQSLFGPRFSFAWTPKGNAEWSVRGGAGLFFDRPEGNLYFGGAGNGPVNSPPYVVSAQYQNGSLSAPGGGSTPAPAPLGTISAMDRDLKVPRQWSWSFTVQRELGWGVFGEIGYVGAKGQNLLGQPDLNQVSFEALGANAALPAAQRVNTNFLRSYKGYSEIRMWVSDRDSRYDAMQLFLSRRKGRLRGTLSYTLGRARDNASGNTDLPEDYLNKDYTWGPANHDRTHILVGTWTWQLPFFKDQKGAGRVLGGWEVSGIGRWQSGAPMTITGNTSIGGRRADFLDGDPYVPESERIAPNGQVLWLKREAFTSAPDGRRGNSGRNQFRGPSLVVWDVSLRKQFRLSGDVRLGIEAGLFNALNHTTFRNPQTNLANADFGVISAVGPPRNIQLGARLTF